MVIEKSSLNGIRNILKRSNEVNRKRFNELEEDVSYLENISIKDAILKRTAIINKINQKWGFSYSLDVSIKDVLDGIAYVRDAYSLEVERVKTVIDALGLEGFKKVTYGLPIVNWSCMDGNLDFSYLMLTGIKKNALEKNINSKLVDEDEQKLFDLECTMNRFIDGEYRIEVKHITTFINFYGEYLKYYYESKHIISPEGFNLEMEFYQALYEMGLYAFYRQTGVRFLEEDYKKYFIRYYEFIIRGFTVGGAVKLLFKELNKDLDNRHAESTLSEKSESSIEADLLRSYIENERVVKTCDLKEFELMLEEAGILDNRKDIYMAQMQALVDKEEQDKYEDTKKRFLKGVLSPEEMVLYYVNRSSQQNHNVIEVIDDIVDEALVCQDKDEKELLMSMLHENIRDLAFDEKEKEDISNYISNSFPVLYYLEDTVIDGVSIKIPRMFKSIIGIGKKEYKEVRSQFMSLLLEGKKDKDREVNGKSLPCRIWTREVDRRKYRLFYTVIGDTIVLIDCVRVDEGFVKISEIASTDEFRLFIESLKEYIATNGTTNAPMFTKMIVDELDKEKVQGKRLKFTQ